jgi:hypothetical protein
LRYPQVVIRFDALSSPRCARRRQTSAAYGRIVSARLTTRQRCGAFCIDPDQAPERGRQNYKSGLRPITLDLKKAHDFVAKPLTPSGQARRHALADHAHLHDFKTTARIASLW